jgi:iron complex outermembrane recepter protein
LRWGRTLRRAASADLPSRRRIAGRRVQWLVGDEANQNPKLPAYWTVNLHSSYKLSKNFELFGLMRNLFNQHYYVYGTFFETDSFPYLNLTDPRTFVPGMPQAAYAGLRGTF